MSELVATTTGALQSPELIQLAEETQQHAANARSSRTQTAYLSDWGIFEAWCAERGAVALPAEPTAVAMFITDQARRLAQSTLRRRLVSISVAHKESDLDSPTTSVIVRKTMQGITRAAALKAKEEGRRSVQRHAEAIDLPKLAAIVGMIDTTTPNGLRDRALLLISFAGGFRRSELVGLTVESLERIEGGIRAHLTISKTDQEGRGTARMIRQASTTLDPVAALDAWLAHAGIESGPIFRAVDRRGRIGENAVSDRTVAQIIKRRAENAGLDATNISGHSTRRGAATTARRNGADAISIARSYGWQDGSTVLNRYFETSI